MTTSAANETQRTRATARTRRSRRRRPRRRANIFAPTWRVIGRQASVIATIGGTDAGRGAQPAEAVRPDVQDVARVRGQERDRAAEQHGEEIERDGAEDHLLAPDEAQALEQRVPAVGRRRSRGLFRLHADDQQERGREQARDRAHRRRPARRGRRGRRSRDRRWSRPARCSSSPRPRARTAQAAPGSA